MFIEVRVIGKGYCLLNINHIMVINEDRDNECLITLVNGKQVYVNNSLEELESIIEAYGHFIKH